MGGIGQRLAKTVDSAVIGRNQPIPFGETCGDAQARDARGSRDPGCDQLAA